MERFCGILIEHFAGAFPMWLSPVQVAVATVSEKECRVRARRVRCVEGGGASGSRLTIRTSVSGLRSIRLRSEQVNYILVVGEQEAAARLLNVNDRLWQDDREHVHRGLHRRGQRRGGKQRGAAR